MAFDAGCSAVNAVVLTSIVQKSERHCMWGT